jgi:hypothetical protein
MKRAEFQSGVALGHTSPKFVLVVFWYCDKNYKPRLQKSTIISSNARG